MNLDNLGRQLIESMPDALIVSDADEVIRVWNAGAERIFGFTSAEALGQRLEIIVPEHLRARHSAGYAQTMMTGETRYGAGDLLSVPAIRKDGRRISIQFSIVPIASADGRLEGIAAIMRDVTADFEARKALKRELEASRRAERQA